jgi:hypothetical protein
MVAFLIVNNPPFGSEVLGTSIAECSNLSLRRELRRFSRLTNTLSKKLKNHWAAVSLWYTFYNFCRVYKSIRTSPAMAAGISDQVWSARG